MKVVGFVGKDVQGDALRSIFEAAGIDTRNILIDPDRPTVTKTRIAGHARQSVTQQIVRVDRKSDELPDSDKQLQLAEQIRQQLDTVDAVVCSDYGDGVFTTAVIEAALSHSRTIVEGSFCQSALALMRSYNIVVSSFSLRLATHSAPRQPSH